MSESNRHTPPETRPTTTAQPGASGVAAVPATLVPAENRSVAEPLQVSGRVRPGRLNGSPDDETAGGDEIEEGSEPAELLGDIADLDPEAAAFGIDTTSYKTQRPAVLEPSRPASDPPATPVTPTTPAATTPAAPVGKTTPAAPVTPAAPAPAPAPVTVFEPSTTTNSTATPGNMAPTGALGAAGLTQILGPALGLGLAVAVGARGQSDAVPAPPPAPTPTPMVLSLGHSGSTIVASVTLPNTVQSGDLIKLELRQSSALPGSTPLVLVLHTVSGTDISSGKVVLNVGQGSQLVDAAYSLSVALTSSSGTVTRDTLMSSYTLDTTAPVAPAMALDHDTGASATDQRSSSPAIKLPSLAADVTQVDVLIDGGSWQRVPISLDANSLPVVQLPTALADGSHTLELRLSDAAGNLSSPYSQLSFTLDRTAPVSPTLSLVQDSGQSGVVATTRDGLSNNGALAVAGLETGALAQYRLIPPGQSTPGVWIDLPAGGQIPTPASGDGRYQVEVHQIDVAGNVSPSTRLNYTLDTQVIQPQIALDQTTGSVAGFTQIGTIHGVTTSIEAGAQVEYGVRDRSAGGNPNTLIWSSSFSPVQPTAAGQGVLNEVWVCQTDVAGNVSARPTTVTAADVPDLSFMLYAPAVAPGIHVPGSVPTDPVPQSSTGRLTLTPATAGSAVQYSLDGGQTWTTVQPASAMAGTVDVALPTSQLMPGSNAVLVRSLEASGPSQAVTATFVYDTLALTPVVTLQSDTASAGDRLSSQAGLQVSGLDPQGRTLSYSFTPVDASGQPLAGAVALSGSLDLTQLPAGATNALIPAPAAAQMPDGRYSVVVTQTDQAGNSASSAPLLFTLDTTTTTPTLGVFQTAAQPPAAGATPVTANGALDVTGIEAGATVDYSSDSGQTWINAPVVAAHAAIPAPASDGPVTVQVRQTDVAGNQRTVSQALVVDTQISPVSAHLSADSASAANPVGSAADRITNSAALTLSNLDPNVAHVAYTLTQVDAGGVAVLNGATSSGTLTPTAGATSLQLAAPANLPDGYYVVRLTQTDLAGNVSTPSTLNFRLDNTLAQPTVTISAAPTYIYPTDPTPVVGDGALVVSGLESGAALDVSFDGATWMPVPVSAAGIAQVPGPAAGSANGTYTVQLRQTDLAGNQNVVSRSYLLDTLISAPTLALVQDTGASASDGITSAGALTIAGLDPHVASLSAVVTPLDAAGSPLAGVSPVTQSILLTAGQTSAALPAPAALGFAADGRYAISATQTDLAGHVSTASTLQIEVRSLAAAPTLSWVNNTDASGNALNPTTQDGRIAVSGLSVGAQVEANVDGGGWTALTPDAQGQFVVAPSASAALLHTVQVRQTDLAGNVSASSSLNYTLDTLAPLAPAVTLQADTAPNGATNTDGITANGNLIITPAEAGGSLWYSLNGGAAWVNNAVTPFAAVSGLNAVSWRQVDGAGNASATTLLSFTLDAQSQAPTLTLAHATVGAGATALPDLVFGGVEAGANLSYSVDGGTNWTSTFVPMASAAGTVNSVLVKQTDVAGNVSTASTALAFTLVGAADAPTVALTLDTGAADGITSNGLLTVTPAANALVSQTQINYSTDQGQSWSTTFTPLEGANTVWVQVSDPAAVDGPSVIRSLSFVFDSQTTVPQLALTQDTASPANVSGFNGDRITFDGRVTVSGLDPNVDLISYTIEPVGGNGLPIAGSTPYVGQMTLTPGTTSAVLPSPETLTGSSFGAGLYRVSVTQTDGAGQTSSATPLIFTLDPTIAAPVLALTADTGPSASDGITSGAQFTVSGLKANATLDWSVDGQIWAPLLTTAPSFSLAADGSYTVQVRQTDIAGHQAVATQTVVRDSVVTATTPVLVLDSGSSNLDGITRDSPLRISGLDPNVDQIGYSFTPVIAGIPQTPVWTLIGGAANPLVRQPDGSVLLPSLPQNGTADGSYVLQVYQTDLAGNSSITTPDSSAVFTLDSMAPAAPTVALLQDTGVSATDGVTTDLGLNITGQEPGAALEFRYTAPGATATAWAPVAAGVMPAIPAGLGDGAYHVEVRQTDAAGNVSAVGQLDARLSTATAAPQLTLIADTAAAANPASSSTDRITSSAVVGVTLADSQASSLSWAWTPLDPVTGLPQAGAVVQPGSLNLPAGSWPQLSLTAPAVDGRYQLDVTQIDVSGATVAAAPLMLTLDTQALVPVISAVSDTGSSASDGVTSLRNLHIGNLEAGAAATWTIAAPNGSSLSGALTVDATGQMLNSPITLDGIYAITVTQTDLAGNTATSAPFRLALDTVAPAAPTSSLFNDTGSTAIDRLSRDGSVLVSSLEAGIDTVDYFIQATDAAGVALVGQAPVTGHLAVGHRSTVLVPSPQSLGLADGFYAVSVTQTDLAGNISPAAPAISMQLDRTLLPASLSLAQDSGVTGDWVSNSLAQIDLSGLEAGSSTAWTLVDTANPGLILQQGALTPSAGGTANIATTIAADGVYRLDLLTTDAAGNGLAQSQTLSRDTLVAAPTATLVSDAGVSAADNITSLPTVTIGGQAADMAELWARWTQAGTVAGAFTQVDLAAIPQAQLPGPLTDGTQDGAWTLETYQIDRAGNTSATGSLSLQLDTLSPVVTQPLTLVADTAPTAGPNFLALQHDGLTANPALTLGFSDAAIDHVDVAVTVDGVAQPLMTVAATPGAFLTLPVVVADGAVSVSATLVDKAGHSTAVPALNYLVDHTAPVVTGVALAFDTGADPVAGSLLPTRNGDGLSSDGTVLLSFTDAHIDHVLYHYSLTDASGNQVLGADRILSTGFGSWASEVTLTAPQLADFPTGQSTLDGQLTLTATLVDQAGNQVAINPLSFTLDTTAPALLSTLLLTAPPQTPVGLGVSCVETHFDHYDYSFAYTDATGVQHSSVTYQAVPVAAAVDNATTLILPGATDFGLVAGTALHGGMTVSITAVDQAGNRLSSGQLAYTFDTLTGFGP
jgi:large repetitive protein